MRPLIAVSVLLLCGCALATEPSRHLALAEIAGYFHDDPRIEIHPTGTSANVLIATFGSSCNALGQTQVRVDGMTATIVPYNFAPPAGTPCPRDLRTFVHETTIHFGQGGTARIRVRGLDVRGRSAANMIGDTITVERTVHLPAM